MGHEESGGSLRISWNKHVWEFTELQTLHEGVPYSYPQRDKGCPHHTTGHPVKDVLDHSHP